MSTSELKNKIILSLNEIEDDSLLTDIFNLLNINEQNKVKYFVDEAEKADLDEAFKNIEEGKIHTNLEAKEIMKEWLKK